MSGDTDNSDKKLNNGSMFEIKGKPSVNLMNADNTKGVSQLSVILQQKVEELRQVRKSKVLIYTTKGTEFKPENTPYLPDSNHPILSKHTLATPERNAGFQDKALVHPMYLGHEKKKYNLYDSTPPDISPEESNIDNLLSIIDRIMPAVEQRAGEVKKSTPVEYGVKPEFSMKINRERMHHGGIYMPNEYRPYKPGE